MKGIAMKITKEELRKHIGLTVDESGLKSIEGCEEFEGIADRVEMRGIEIVSIEGSDHKWSARGMVEALLFNLDDEQFGEVRLHLIASGHYNGSGQSIDSLIISPNFH